MAAEYRRDRKSNISTSRKKQTDAQLFVVGTTRSPTLKCQNLTLGQRGERTQTDNALRNFDGGRIFFRQTLYFVSTLMWSDNWATHSMT